MTMPIDLKKGTSGKLTQAPRVLIFSFEGTGKTSWAAGAPDPYFVDANKGSGAFDVKRYYPEDWGEVNELVTATEDGRIKCKTLVLDTLGDLEAMSHAFLFPGTTITDYGGGFAKGDDVVVAEWRRFLYRLERVWLQGIGIIFTAHAKVKTFQAPVGPAFDRYEVSNRPQLAGLVRGWCDYVFFAQVEPIVVLEKGRRTGKATTTGERFVYTRRTPAYDAKARGTAGFPERLVLSYDAFVEAVKNDGTRGDEMRSEIQSMLAEIGDPALAKQVNDYLKRNPTQIADAHNRVQIRLSEKKTSEEQAAATPGNGTEQPAATAAS
jgi:hypothetical protein